MILDLKLLLLALRKVHIDSDSTLGLYLLARLTNCYCSVVELEVHNLNLHVGRLIEDSQIISKEYLGYAT